MLYLFNALFVIFLILTFLFVIGFLLMEDIYYLGCVFICFVCTFIFLHCSWYLTSDFYPTNDLSGYINNEVYSFLGINSNAIDTTDINEAVCNCCDCH